MIVAEGVSLKVKNKMLLQAVSVQIPFANVTAILGPNGAGKSTLLKCLTGILSFDSGLVKLDGQAIDSYSLSELAQRRAVLSQSVAIDFPFTAFEVVMMGRAPHTTKRSLKQDDEITEQALAMVDALAMRDRDYTTLSGGEQQRVQLARVIAQLWGEQNKYLFLDEPTSALDLKHQHQVLKLVRNLAVNKGMAITLVLHDLNLALRYADNVLLMKEGKLVASGNTREVLSHDNIEAVFEVPMASIFYDKGMLLVS